MKLTECYEMPKKRKITILLVPLQMHQTHFHDEGVLFQELVQVLKVHDFLVLKICLGVDDFEVSLHSRVQALIFLIFFDQQVDLLEHKVSPNNNQ